jgi:hypothetical protein
VSFVRDRCGDGGHWDLVDDAADTESGFVSRKGWSGNAYLDRHLRTGAFRNRLGHSSVDDENAARSIERTPYHRNGA